jgi:hypothetical protein
MNPDEAVLWAFKWLVDHHSEDLLSAEQVNFGLLAKSVAGDDIWLRTNRIHVVAEVTMSGAGIPWPANGRIRQEIVAKIGELRNRLGVTHKYLFVGESIAASVAKRRDTDGIKVVPVPQQNG